MRFAFPNQNDAQSGGFKCFDFCCVAPAVGSEFRDPEFTVALWDRGVRASFMVVPEAAIDEDRPFASLVGEIGRAGEAFDIAAIV